MDDFDEQALLRLGEVDDRAVVTAGEDAGARVEKEIGFVLAGARVALVAMLGEERADLPFVKVDPFGCGGRVRLRRFRVGGGRRFDGDAPSRRSARHQQRRDCDYADQAAKWLRRRSGVAGHRATR